jgi:hypothetical protein
MTLDASGNLTVGTTTNSGRLTVADSTAAGTATNTFVSMQTLEDSSTKAALTLRSLFTNAQQTNTLVASINLGVITNGTASPSAEIRFNTIDSGTFTERARITSGGDLYVGTQTDLAGNTAKLQSDQQTASRGAIVAKNITSTSDNIVSWNAATSGDNIFVGFYTETAITARGSITYNRAGGLVAYNTTSDYRAKDIIGPVANPGATIDALKVYEGKMKGATQSRPMLVAHEAQEHVPYAVTGEKDAVNEDGTAKFQQMDVSSLVPLLLAEIQSLRARVKALEGA